jgi:hypothetical protein
MSKSAFTKEILLFEGIGFGVVLSLLWLNEALDLPHYLFAAPSTPVNWRESILESVVVCALAAGTLLWSHRALARIRYLEGYFRVCMYCKRIQAHDKWIPIEQYVIDHTEAVLSHSICPECKQKHHPQLME